MNIVFKKLESLYKELISSPVYRFPAEGQKLNASKMRGVYIIRNKKKRVLHAGATPRARKGIYQRLNDHLSGNSSFTNKYLKGDGSRLRRNYYYQFLEIPDSKMRMLLEAYAAICLKPEHWDVGLD